MKTVGRVLGIFLFVYLAIDHLLRCYLPMKPHAGGTFGIGAVFMLIAAVSAASIVPEMCPSTENAEAHDDASHLPSTT